MEFKGCTRCNGDLYREEDIGQTDLVCLQCGFRLAEDTMPVISVRRARPRRTRTRNQARPARAAA
jgi:DNA-directed RNA polymerase subunit RPC12/RpoP